MKKNPYVEVVLVNARGSTPADQGARAKINQDGLMDGTIGGGKVEAKAILHAQDLLKDTNKKKTDFVTWNLQKDVGMTCGGEVSFYFEIHQNKTWNVAVFGAGHVSQALIKILATLDLNVYCIDPRSEWLDKMENYSNITKIQLEEPKNYVAELPLDTFFILMTKGHATDVPVLYEVLKNRKAPFVGVIGSDSKKNVILKDLKNLNLEINPDAFYCPIGMPIGNNSPEEIAISITSQLLMIRDKNKGASHV